MDNNKPYAIPATTTEKLLEAGSLLGILLIIGILLWAWPHLPPKLPVHFGLQGEPDSWGSKSTLMIFPAIALIQYIILTALGLLASKLLPQGKAPGETATKQLRAARTLFSTMKIGIILVLLIVEWKVLQVGLGRASGLGTGFLLEIILLLMVVQLGVVAILITAFRTQKGVTM